MTSKAWSIRPASEVDIDATLSLWVAAGSPPSATDTREGLLALLGSDREALLLAEAVGYVRQAEQARLVRSGTATDAKSLE